METLVYILESSLFKGICFFIVTLIGAFITEMLSLYADTEGVKPFLRRIKPGKNKQWYIVANAILLPLIGTILSFIILEPDSVKSSLCAGLAWCGTLQSLGLTLESKKS